MMRALPLLIALLASAVVMAQPADSPRENVPVVEEGPISVRMWPSAWSVSPIEPVTLTFEATIESGWNVESPLQDLAIGDTLGGMTVEAISARTVARVDDGRLRISRTVTLAPDLPGPVTLGPYRITARRAGSDEAVELRTAPVELTVNSLLAGAEDSFTPGSFRAPLDSQTAPAQTSLAFAIAIGVASGLLVVLLAGALLFVRARRRAANSPEARLRQLREELESLVTAHGDPRSTALAADSITRRALSLTVMPDAPSLTSQELLARTDTWPERAALRAALASVLTSVERVVFAGDDNVSASDIVEQARRVLDATPTSRTDGGHAA